MSFPETRPRRLRRTPALRRMVRETTLAPDNFVYPLFVGPGKGVRREISSLPGQFQFSVDEVVREAEEVAKLGIPSVILFGLPEKKDDVGSEAWHPEGVVQRALRAIKKAVPELVLAVDACFCEYTTHGHCGVVLEGEIDNDATLDNLGRAALSYAKAGADLVAPSGMMDGFVGFLRESLDEDGFEKVGLLAYSAKFALDVEEGADIVMVKPALAYLDVIAEARGEFDVPIAAYNVSGEYAMLKAAAEKGWIDYDRVMMETLTSIRRAGADIILTYHAKEAARLLRR
jgi:porphobilinogen synthase